MSSGGSAPPDPSVDPAESGDVRDPDAQPEPVSLPPLLVDEEADPLDVEPDLLLPFIRFY
jgi:hypothetical protein